MFISGITNGDDGHAALTLSITDKAMEGIRKQIIEVRASVEACIDFGDYVELKWGDIHVAVSSMISELSSIQEQMHRGTLINEGLRIVILGQTNVGKSSLFNRIGNIFSFNFEIHLLWSLYTLYMN